MSKVVAAVFLLGLLAVATAEEFSATLAPTVAGAAANAPTASGKLALTLDQGGKYTLTLSNIKDFTDVRSPQIPCVS